MPAPAKSASGAASAAQLELLTFLSDANAQVRQVALSHAVQFSPTSSPHRSLLTQQRHVGSDGKPLRGRDGAELDVVRELKKLCRDQPLTAVNAFSALINLTDSALVAHRVVDEAFLAFLVSYIADPSSILADLACMLLSNLTKVEPACHLLLTLRAAVAPPAPAAAPGATAPPISPEEAAKLAEAFDAERGADETPEHFEERRREAVALARRVGERAAQQQQQSPPIESVPALLKLIEAFEEGAEVVVAPSASKQGATLEEMRRRAVELGQKQAAAAVEASSGAPPLASNGGVRRRSNCNFLASVFANLTATAKGREWFVEPISVPAPSQDGEASVELPVSRLVAFTEHPDLIRRGGIISALKNILFVRSAHKLLIAPPSVPPADVHGKPSAGVRLLPDGDGGRDAAPAVPPPPSPRPRGSIDVLPNLLLPLCSGEEMASLDAEDQESLPDECQMLSREKRREPDAALRLMLVECLLLLCTALYGRRACRGRGVYVVVREAHLHETDEKIADAVHRLVNILKRDESEATLRDDDGEGGTVEGAEGDGGGREAREAVEAVESAMAKAEARTGRGDGEVPGAKHGKGNASGLEHGGHDEDDEEDAEMRVEEI